MKCSCCKGEMAEIKGVGFYCPDYQHPRHLLEAKNQQEKRAASFKKKIAGLSPAEIEYIQRHYRY